MWSILKASQSSQKNFIRIIQPAGLESRNQVGPNVIDIFSRKIRTSFGTIQTCDMLTHGVDVFHDFLGKEIRI